ncbi:zinc ABC transporter substrate-binding protein, partial [Anaerolineae bacterium CFX4]|nr:zinc ABC transporter substrate-binding protein [Anaerolineae bacterium CFX4]
EHSAVHAHGTCDPHVWSDPRSVVYWSLFIGDVVGALDPAHADQYTANAHEYAYAIDDLLRLQLEPELAVIPPENRLLLTNHETLGYFASAYGFDVLGFVLPGGSTLAEPSARDVAALVELVRSSGVKAIFVETTVVSRVAELVAAEAGTPLVSLYTDSLSDVQGPAPTYLDYTAYNFAAITDALAP